LHASSGHTNDPEPSGVWKPADKHHFWIHDSTANLYAIGQYTSNFRGILKLVNLVKSGAAPDDKMLTANINLGQSQLDEQFIASFERTMLDPLLDMQNAGEIKIATYNQIVDEWKTVYDSVGYIYNAPTQTSVKNRNSDILDFQLEQNYPNPFNLETKLFFQLTATKQVNLAIYDVLGKKVRTLVNSEMTSGSHQVIWDGKDELGNVVSSGIYMYQLKTNENLSTLKMLLIK